MYDFSNHTRKILYNYLQTHIDRFVVLSRPTIFIEIIQRIGCMLVNDNDKMYQKPGCGGFGKGNISELFKSVEEYEKTLETRPSNISSIS